MSQAAIYHLQSQLKGVGTAYMCWFLLGCHYAYLNRWGIQILYWITLGGMGIWMIIDLFRLGGIVQRHNDALLSRINEIEQADHDRHMQSLASLRNV